MERRNIFQRMFRRSKKKIVTWHDLSNTVQGDLAYWLTGLAMKSPEITTIINTIAEIFSTIPTYHKRTDQYENVTYLEDNLHRILNVDPNPLQNRTQFWIDIVSKWLKNNNVIVMPEWDRRGNLKTIAALPNETFFPMEDTKGNFYLDISTPKGLVRKYVEELIILSRFCTLKGGGSSSALSLPQRIMSGILEQAHGNIISPNTVQAYLKIRQGNLSPEAAKKRAEEVAGQISAGAVGSNGFKLPYIQGDVDLQSINISNEKIDNWIYDYAKTIAMNYFGMTDDVLQRKVNSFGWQLFIATTIKPLARQASEEFTRKLFTTREKDFGNAIEFDVSALQVATIQDVTNFMRVSIPMGVANADEVRDILGYGKKTNRMGGDYKTTLNIVNEDIADQYQLGQQIQGSGIPDLPAMRKKNFEVRYDPDQPRDEKGRFAETEGSSNFKCK